MKRVLPLLFSGLFTASTLSAQVFWTEDFLTGCNDSNFAAGTVASQGMWTVTNPGFNDLEANMWYISASEQNVGACSVGCSGANSRSLHIGPISAYFLGIQVVTADGGARYSAQGVNNPATTDTRAESPVINCNGKTGITLSFKYLEGGDGANDDGEVWYNDGTGFVFLANPTKTTCCGGACTGLNQGVWSTFTVALPASADNNPNVQVGFRWANNDDGTGTDPSFAIDDITLSVTANTPVVTITPSPNDSICVNATLTLNGSATNGPITDWAWTVSSPSVGVVFIPDSSAQNPDVTFTTPGTYTFTLFATNGDPSTGSSTQVITVLPTVTPTATLTAPAGTLCAGSNICFTVNPTNGGTAPTFQWDINGVPDPGTTASLCSSLLNNNDVVSCTVTSNDVCLATNTVSVSFTVSITPTTVPSVTITADDSSICAGTTVNFTATPTNGGATPAYQWQINGLPVGINSANFSSATLNNNDTVLVVLTSSDVCPSPATAQSDTIFIVVTPTVVPSTVLTPDVINPVCAGTPVSFTATPTNGGTTPVYQWDINGTPSGINSPDFGPNAFTNGDVVSVTMTSNATCATPTAVTTSYTVQVTTPLVPSVTVTPDPASGCTGSSVTFTATPTNGGTTPAYQWIVNGSNAGINSSTFTLNNIAGGEVVSVVLTSNATCVTTNTVSSNTVTVTIIAPPVLTVTHGTATVCPGLADTLIATATAGSTFSWTPSAGLNVTANDSVIATNVATGIYTYYVTATLAGCSSIDSVQVTVSNGLVATAGPPSTICQGQSAPLSVAGGTDWQWTPATGNIVCDTCQNTTASPTVTTTFSVVASIGACTDTVYETITVIPNASISFNTSSTSGIPQTVTFTNTTTNAIGFYWTFGDNLISILQTPVPHTYNSVGTYTVVLIAYGQNSCNDTLATVLNIIDTVGLTVPNVFTPNGDEINDIWQPSVHGAKTFECTIFDRWGLKVYEFAGDQDHWDGHTTAGLACKDGTYYYILKATDTNNKAYDLKGFIQLIH